MLEGAPICGLGLARQRKSRPPAFRHGRSMSWLSKQTIRRAGNDSGRRIKRDVGSSPVFLKRPLPVMALAFDRAGP